MFAHQVIEDLQSGKNMRYFSALVPTEDKAESLRKWEENSRGLIPLIQRAQKFHVGDATELHAMFGDRDKDVIFNNDLSGDCRLPYRECWVDFFWCGSMKLGLLALEAKPDVLQVFFSVRGADKDTDIRWFTFAPVFAIVSVGKRFQERDDLDEIRFYTVNEIGRGGPSNVAMISLGVKKSDILERAENDIWRYLLTLERFLTVLHCKNIVTEKIKAPEPLNKKRRKAGKQELFSYHVLNVVVPSKRRGSGEVREPLSHNRVHLCRGHFKDYTTTRPLFGRVVGRYWWQPHARGQNRDGIVMKDYKLEVLNG